MTIDALVRTPGRDNRLRSTRNSGRMVNEYWSSLYRAREEGRKVLWYNGQKMNVFAQAAGVAWVHGEAYSALLAARHLEGPAQKAASDHGFMQEVCSYSRTHMGCALAGDSGGAPPPAPGEMPDAEAMARGLPVPDMLISAYPGCSSGQQWDDALGRLFGQKLPVFNVNIPFLWGNQGDGIEGPEWEGAVRYLTQQLRESIAFIEQQTGRPFDMDELCRIMSYVKQAAILRNEAMALCSARPSPASYFDWIASIAPLNFMPASQALVDYYAGVKTEIEERIARGEGAVRDEKYRLYFDGIMNWNNLGLLSKKFASYGATVMCGRYTHRAFWTQPHLIDVNDPLPGIAKHFLLCPLNHSVFDQVDFALEDSVKYGVDGMVFHVSRTCRSMTSPQYVMAEAAQRKLGLQTMMFEGDVADVAFYDDAIMTTRLEAMLESIEMQRQRVAA
ncbi:2-hydroxyacyl-CoA dehydratase subunit D [Ramlibacter sp.]|uniref:2-hydroxyacyl-CoA dehydratase subunit D n=1 Tax=Ramlibacter sp. TaxID=1917967 RepID=UPI003D0D0A07